MMHSSSAGVIGAGGKAIQGSYCRCSARAKEYKRVAMNAVIKSEQDDGS